MFQNDFDIMLYVQDIDRSLAFYHRALGFDFNGWWSEEDDAYVKDWRTAGEPGYAELSAGPIRLSLHSADHDVPSGGCIVHLRVEDIDAFRSQAEHRGADLSEPVDEPWGWRMSMTEDPDGHQWGFYTPLKGG